jgi:ABC-type uncharacterized transport system YnjBCD permease subunit
LPVNSKQFYVLALLLAAIFSAAQLHCCFDLNASPSDSHICPVCHTLGAAIAACAVIIGIAGSPRWLEILHSLPPLLPLSFRNITPRAPPVDC